MGMRSVVVVAGMLMLAIPGASQAQGFFESLFGAFGGAARAPADDVQRRVIPQRRATQPLIFGDERAEPRRRSRGSKVSKASTTSGSGEGAFCVRACDGRYFPVPSAGGQSRAEVCSSFCPASDTAIYYGSSIDSAESSDGRPYSALRNAFRFRNEVVPGCTCNGKEPFGLARIDINEDPTLRKGDIVASGDGLMVATGRVTSDGVALSAMPASVRARFAKVPLVAKE